MCTVEADTSATQPRKTADAMGASYSEMNYGAALLFGFTELKAQLAWREDVSLSLPAYSDQDKYDLNEGITT